MHRHNVCRIREDVAVDVLERLFTVVVLHRTVIMMMRLVFALCATANACHTSEMASKKTV